MQGKIILFTFAGFLLGSVAGVYFNKATTALDKGISETYGAAEREHLDKANATLKLVLLDQLGGKPSNEIRDMLHRLDIFEFDKRTEGTAGGDIFFVYEEGYLINIER